MGNILSRQKQRRKKTTILNDINQGQTSTIRENEITIHTLDTSLRGQILVRIATGHSILDYDKPILELCFEDGQNHAEFRKYHIDAVRAAVKNDNVNLVHYLLEKDTSGELLKDEIDLLQLTLPAGVYHWLDQRDPLQLIRLLLSHGAQVNSKDHQGITPLYCACTHGASETFNALISAGADYTARYTTLPTTRDPTPVQQDGMPEYNLLKITVEALATSEVLQKWVARAYSTWIRPILFLIDAGFTLSLNDPSVAALLQAAGEVGNRDEFEKVLRSAVYPGESRGSRINSAISLTKALHSATSHGHVEIVRSLLKFGAWASGLLEYDEFGTKRMKTAIEVSCGDNGPLQFDPKPAEILDACELLLEGVSVADRRFVFEEAARQGRIDTVNSLLDAGVSLEEAPITRSLDVIEILRKSETHIRWDVFLKDAIRLCWIERAKWIVGEAGPAIKTPDAMEKAYRDLFNRYPLQIFGSYFPVEEFERRRDEMIYYLIKEYGRGPDDPISMHAEVNKSLLTLASRSNDTRLIRVVIEAELSSESAGLGETAYEIVQSILQTGTSGKFLHRKLIEAMQLLISCSDESLGRHSNSDLLWLTPEHLPAKLHAELCSSPGQWSPDQQQTWRRRDPSKQKVDTNSVLEELQKAAALLPGVSDGQLTEGIESQLPEEIERYALEYALSVPHENMYQYEKLQDLYGIRLMVLEPSQDPRSPIRCKLHLANLGRQPDYEALSYVWGDQGGQVRILVDKKGLNITKNLSVALRRLRLSTQSRVLWVDAICINQPDKVEKAQQVRMMRNIYQSARQVIIWVGEHQDDSQLVFEHIRTWRDTSEERYKRIHRDIMNEGTVTDSTFNPHPYTGKVKHAYEKFCHRSWFRRAWVIQEFVVSKQAVFMCGPDTALVKDLIQPAALRKDRGHDVLRGRSGPRHFRALSDLGRGASIRSVLDYSSTCRAWNPLDKVFALLGLFDDPLIKVDYHLPVKVVYTNFTQALIQNLENVHLWHWFGARRRNGLLPSWVPDFNSDAGMAAQHRVERRNQRYTPVSKTLEKVLHGPKFQGSEIIIRGFHVENVLQISDELVAKLSNIPGSSSFTETIRNWEILATQLQDKRFSESILAAFLRTLRTHDAGDLGFYDEIDDQIAHYIAWYETFASGTLKSFDNEYFQQMEVILEWWGGLYQDHWMKVDTEQYTSGMKDCCYGRRFFLSDEGSMGLTHAETKPGDFIVFFPGGLYPFILRPHPDGGFELIGDCYLYDFDEYAISKEELEQCVEFILR